MWLKTFLVKLKKRKLYVFTFFVKLTDKNTILLIYAQLYQFDESFQDGLLNMFCRKGFSYFTEHTVWQALPGFKKITVVETLSVLKFRLNPTEICKN